MFKQREPKLGTRSVSNPFSRAIFLNNISSNKALIHAAFINLIQPLGERIGFFA